MQHRLKMTRVATWEAETGEGYVDAGLRAAVGGGGHGAADGLQDEGDDVAGDEDVVEEDG